MPSRERIYRERLLHVRAGIKAGKSANAIYRELQSTQYGMRRKDFLAFVKTVATDKAPETLPGLPFKYAPSRFQKDQEYNFQGHVLDFWRRDIYADVEVIGEEDNPYWEEPEAEEGSPPTYVGKTKEGKFIKFVTIFLGQYSRLGFIKKGKDYFKQHIIQQLKGMFDYEPEWRLLGIWAKKRKASEGRGR